MIDSKSSRLDNETQSSHSQFLNNSLECLQRTRRILTSRLTSICVKKASDWAAWGALHSRLSPVGLWVLPGCWIDSLLLCQSSCSHFMTICLSMECLFSAFQYIPNRSSVSKTRLDSKQSRNILPSLTAPYQILMAPFVFPII